MIKISKLHLKNFKSFRKAEIPFSDGFTAIVGANASGKSNILDSILFSLGITSLKMLRASKLTELVNSNSEEPFARVAIELKDTERKVNYEITRIIDSQGKGDFRLDGKRVGLNEITAFLIELGIRPDGHNLVVQGDITKVIEMSPKQRREVIDDVAGLAEFDEKKEESLKELERVEEKIRETMIVLRERKAFVDQLMKEREGAEKFVKLNSEMASCKFTLIKQELGRISAEAKISQRKEKEFEEAKRKFSEQKAKAKQSLESLAARLAEIDRKIIAANSMASGGVMKKLEEKRLEVGLARERLNSKSERLERSGARKKGLEARRLELATEENDKRMEKGVLDAQLVELEKRIGAREKESSSAQNEIDEARKKSLELGERHRELLSRLEQEKKNYHFAREREAEVQGEINSNRKLLAELSKGEQKKEALAALSRLSSLLREISGLVEKASSAGKKTKDARTGKILLELAEAGKRIEKGLAEARKALENLTKAKLLEEKLGKFSELEKGLAAIAREKVTFEKSVSLLEARARECANELEKARKILLSQKQVPRELLDKRTELIANVAIIEERLGKAIAEERKRIETEMQGCRAEEEALEKVISSERQGLEVQEKEFKILEAECNKIRKENESVIEEKRESQELARKAEAEREEAESGLSETERKHNEFRLSQSRNQMREADLEEELKSFRKLPEEIKGKGPGELRKRMAEIEEEIRELGAINMKALEAFEQYKAEIAEVNGKVEVLEREKQSVLDLIQKIEVRRTEVFMECFNAISKNFGEIYYSVFTGEGRISLTDQSSPTEAGLFIEAKHKNTDKLKSIDSMSGGEKAMTALAFLFAIQLYRPAPFYVFDEADSALDRENSAKLAKMIGQISRKSQFIAITHNDTMIQEADQIVGVTLNQQKSSVIGLKLKEKLGQGGVQEP